MIIDPDFLDHWRTCMFASELGNDPCAPLYIIRLWAHCQKRRADSFDDLSPNALKAICKYTGDAQALENALSLSGYIERKEKALSVLKWAEHNSKLIANWSNGKLGGRPKAGKPVSEKKEGKSKSVGFENQNETQSNPTETDKMRQDETREDKSLGNTDVLPPASDAGAPVLQSDNPPIDPDSEPKDENKAYPPCPHKEIVALYHEILPECPVIREWTPARQAHLRARWNGKRKRQSLEYWRSFFLYVKECPFLLGQADGGRGGRPFVASLDWMVVESNFTKIVEGRYAPND